LEDFFRIGVIHSIICRIQEEIIERKDFRFFASNPDPDNPFFERNITFTELKKLLSVSDGNLSVHLKKLEDANFITVEKKFEGRKPQTTYKLTEFGKKEFIEYLNKMEVVLKKLKETNNNSKS